ncbi:MAG TPA: response regulator [Candidatus Eremiobacteraeota bacterium]|nr:MAG: Alkaline phosphatase synthesis transcriptional regulatory protein PhoP [bacterium ADurb.Bin363]HPZ06518.1 response regulator [Candidatus Eremiobacteraeota bacterium]
MTEKKIKILVIDDKEELLMLVAVIFEDTGYEIIGLKNSLEAFETAIKEQPDVIILDIMMPKMDGWEVFKKIKGNPLTAHTPVLILSVMADREEAEKGKEMGADAIMRKPFEPNKLIKIVNKILNTEEKHSV